MLHLIPARLHRIALRWAHSARHRWRLIAGQPLAGVSVLLTDPEGRLLLVRHSYGPQGWALPGGGVKKHEAPETAARREIAEEIGCALQDVRVFDVVAETISGSPHTAYLVTACTQDRPRPDTREVIEARFFARQELPEGQTPLTRRRIQVWLAQTG